MCFALRSSSHQIAQAERQPPTSTQCDVRHAAAVQSLLRALTHPYRNVRLRIFVVRQIFGSCLLTSIDTGAPTSELLAIVLRRAGYRSRRAFMARWTSALSPSAFSVSEEPSTSRRNSFATSSMTSGVTLGNRLAYVVMSAFSQSVLIRRGKPRE